MCTNILQHTMTEILTEPSICIPRTLSNVSWRDVKDTFETLLGRGTVERVDIVRSKDSEQPFCRIFVHFRYWPNTPDIMAIRQRLIDGEVIKVVYNNPWFWKCAASRVPKPNRDQPKTAPYFEVSTPQAATSNPGDDAAEMMPPPPLPPPLQRQPASSNQVLVAPNALPYHHGGWAPTVTVASEPASEEEA